MKSFPASPLAALALLAAGCGDTSSPRPNVLWIVWDTVRADRLCLYGAAPGTTPFLDRWAVQARVFEDCTSAANSTVASHASMFTGYLPSEHGADAAGHALADEFATAAERFRDAGYRTYLFSSNPFVSALTNLQQGFDVVEHPWSARYREEASRIVRGKVHPDDRSTELPRRVRRGRLDESSLKASGSLIRRALTEWLDGADPVRPWFACLNYMEAHRPLIPPEPYRRRFLDDEGLARAYEIDRSWRTMWSYTFGRVDYSEEELRILRATYDAALAELDDLLADLLTTLETRGDLEDTIVVLVADHGEQLGEHHMLDHQYSVYDALIRVPLVIRGLEPGRDRRPVSSLDILPTLLRLARIEGPTPRRGTSLLDAIPSDRRRVAEYPADFEEPLAAFEDLDPSPWRRRLRALYQGRLKLIRASDGSVELYDRVADPGELRDLAPSSGDEVRRMTAALDEVEATMETFDFATPERTPTAEERARLEALGYLGPGGTRTDDR